MKLPPKKYMVLVILVVCLNVIDVATTVVILLCGGGEANMHFAHFNVSGIGIFDYLTKGALCVFWATAMFALHWISRKENSKVGMIAGYLMLMAVNLFYLWVVTNNLQVLWSMKQCGR